MSLYPRDYMKDESRPGIGGPSTWSVVTRLIALNLLVYLLNNLIFADPARDWFGLSLEALKEWRIWTPVTYAFVHATPWHLLANLVGLFFVGRMLLQLVPAAQVVWIYLLGAVCGGILQLVWNALSGTDPAIVGASGSVLAIVFAAITLAPFQRVRLLLFFLVPVDLSLRQIGWILIALNALSLILPQSASDASPVAVMAHFGGILWGWAHIRLGWHRRLSVVRVSRKRKIAPKGRPDRTRSDRTRSDRTRSDRSRPDRSRPDRSRPDRAAPRAAEQRPVSADVDSILDKINAEGFQSLTPEERHLLEQSSRRLSRDRDD